MTSRERVHAVLNGDPVDRVPVIGGFITNPDWLAHSAGVDVAEFWSHAERYALEAYHNSGSDVIVQFVLPKRPEVTTGDGERLTNFSRKERDPRDEFPTVESVIEHVRGEPGPEERANAFDRQAFYDFYVEFMRDRGKTMEPIVWVPGHICGCPPFQHGYDYYGYDNYLTAMLEAPEAFRRYFDGWGEHVRLQNVEMVRATREHDLLPVVYCGQDICYGAGPICSPDLLERTYMPGLRRALKPLAEAEIEIVWHSDGYIMPIIESLLAAGVTGFQGLEEDHGMSVEELSGMTDRRGRPLVLWGSISVTSTLPFGTPDDVRADVRRCVEIAERTGMRLFLAPSSSVGPEVPVENIAAFFEYASG